MYICIITLHSADMYPLSLLFLLVGSNWIHKHIEVGYNITMITTIFLPFTETKEMHFILKELQLAFIVPMCHIIRHIIS